VDASICVAPIAQIDTFPPCGAKNAGRSTTSSTTVRLDLFDGALQRLLALRALGEDIVLRVEVFELAFDSRFIGHAQRASEPQMLVE
jgi:hypothetical protein